MKDKDIHAYYNEEGKRIPSVTQVVSLLAKQGISEWANMLGFYHKNYDKVLKEYAENGKVSDATLKTVGVLRSQLTALKQTIQQYAILELKI